MPRSLAVNSRIHTLTDHLEHANTACMESTRSKLASPQMAKCAQALAGMLAHGPRAKHTVLGCMCVGRTGQRVRVEWDDAMTAPKDVNERPYKARLHEGLEGARDRFAPCQLRSAVPSTSASHHLNSRLRAEEQCKLPCCRRAA